MHNQQSFGETDILENGSYLAGRLRVTGVRADPALAPRLRVTLGVQLQRAGAGTPAAASPAVEVREIAGELHATGPGPDGAGRDGLGVYVGRLLSAGPPRVVPVLAHGHETSVELACDLSPLALERLEMLRAGRALRLTLTPWLDVWAGGRPVDAFAARAFAVMVPQEHWLNALDALASPGVLGAARAALLEVRFAPADAVPFRAAAERLREALRLVDRGHYNEAVAKCRIAYEELLAEEPGWVADGGKGLWTALAPAFHARTAPLYKQIAGALKQLSALTHHAYGADVAFTRAEALFVVTTTASLMAVLGEASTRAHGVDSEAAARADAAHARG